MDFGGELFWVVMVIFYLVFQIFGARKKKQQHQKRRPEERRPQPVSGQPEKETELDEALREIRRALGFPDDEQEVPPPRNEPARQRVEAPPPIPQRAESPSQPSRPVPRPAESRPRPIEKPPVRPLPPVRPTKFPPVVHQPRTQRHPPGRTARPAGDSRSFDKATFQRKSAFEKFDEQSPTYQSPVGITETAVERPPDVSKTARLTHLVERLQKPSTAREAFLMKEILDPPKALRKRR